MIAVDTNILVYAHRKDSPFHESALKGIRRLAEGTGAWAIPWPCVHEFYSVATNPRGYQPSSSPSEAREQIVALMASPSLRLLAETDQHWVVLQKLLEGSHLRGVDIQDAKIAAICIQHGVREFWSADRDFSRFRGLKTVNPRV